jgi:hypothetical protein
MPAAADDGEQAKRECDMDADLAALHDDAKAGELSSAEFYDRLTDIHVRHLGDDAAGSANAMSRVRALRHSRLSDAKLPAGTTSSNSSPKRSASRQPRYAEPSCGDSPA